MSHPENRLSKQASEMNARLLRALGNPERQRILVILSERLATPKELQEDLTSPLEVVSRHCRVMRNEGLIELVETDSRRGGKQHVYRGAVRPYLSTEMWEQLPQLVREMHSAVIIQDQVNKVAEAMAAGTFDSVVTNANVSAGFVVDDVGFAAIAQAYEDLFDRLVNIQSDSAARLTANGEEGTRVQSWLLAYPSADDTDC